VPLAINLQRRARAELETQTLVRAQTIAAGIGAENVAPSRRRELQNTLIPHYAAQVEGRVIVVDRKGVLIADSDGPQHLGEAYATAGRPEIIAAVSDKQPNADVRYSADLGHDIMVAAAPILDEAKLYGAVRISQDMAEVQANVRRVTAGLVAIGLAGLAAGLILAFGLADSLSRPLSRLAEAARRLGRGDLSARSGETRGAREIAELAGSFDDMAERLESTVRAQREFVANASHQLRTPLTGMKLRLESAIAEAPSGDLRKQLEAADNEVDRLADIVDRLLVMARKIEQGETARVDLGPAVARAVERWGDRAQRRGATLQAKGNGGAVQGDETDLDQILDNLIDNALSYAPGPIEIETGRTDDRVFVAVLDRGPGILPDEVGRVTERFYRGRGAPLGGTGLGLAIVRDLAERWGGTVVVDNREGGGTRVEVQLRSAEP